MQGEIWLAGRSSFLACASCWGSAAHPLGCWSVIGPRVTTRSLASPTTALFTPGSLARATPIRIACHRVATRRCAVRRSTTCSAFRAASWVHACHRSPPRSVAATTACADGRAVRRSCSASRQQQVDRRPRRLSVRREGPFIRRGSEIDAIASSPEQRGRWFGARGRRHYRPAKTCLTLRASKARDGKAREGKAREGTLSVQPP